MPFTPPAGTGLNNAPTVYTKTQTFNAGIATSVSAVTTPAVPATTVAAANTTGVDVIVYVVSGGGAVTVISVNGTATGAQVTATSGITATVYLPAGQTIALTYASTAPTWVWQAV